MPASSNAIATCFTTPESTPEVMIQAPVVFAAYNFYSKNICKLKNCKGNLEQSLSELLPELLLDSEKCFMIPS